MHLKLLCRCTREKRKGQDGGCIRSRDTRVTGIGLLPQVADADSRHPNVHLVSYLLLYLSACMNPLIYGATNRQYRQAYRALLVDCLPATASQDSDDQQQQQTTPSSRTLVSTVASPSPPQQPMQHFGTQR
ncbi:unnamed protein product [Ixodes pacificus]